MAARSDSLVKQPNAGTRQRMSRKKPAPHLMRGGHRFSGKDMRKSVLLRAMSLLIVLSNDRKHHRDHKKYRRPEQQIIAIE
jgi:hypothetical protein